MFRIESIDYLAECGLHMREPYVKYLEEGIFELRVQFAKDKVRIFYFFEKDNMIILTNGFLKKTKKTPVKYLKLAKKYKRNYENGIGGIG